MNKLNLFCFAMALTTSAFAQDLYKPRNIINAFKKGTRSDDGRPGRNYWQNHARYSISIAVSPPKKNVSGAEDIVYFNNSPDTLKNLFFKLIVNVHKPGAARQNPASDNYLTSGVHIDAYRENGAEKKWDDAGSTSNKRIALTKPLAPHDSVKVSIAWHFDMSVESGREGAIDSTTFYLAYFYPRIAVYDDYNGWDRMQFTDAQEFYNDFNDYTFQVTAPRNFIVWATGDLLNADEVLQPGFARRLKESMTSDSVIHIANAPDLAAKNITVAHDRNTWKWRANDISDVTIAISDHYVWDASSVIVDDAAHRRASVQAAFDDRSLDFHQMVGFGKHALDWLSHNWPGVPYPFPKTTVVQGFADMEYPMMVNDSHNEQPEFSRFVVEHEIAHTWFPFYMGINETRFGFMDEGWATTFELLINRVDLGKEKAEGLYKRFRVGGWINDPSAEEDIPIITPANILSGAALGNNEYGKAALGYLALKDLLGDDVFRTGLHTFMDRWHGKHPTPWDMFNSFNNGTGKNLNWFWNSWFFSNHYIDLSVKAVKTSSKGFSVTIENIGGYPAPVDLLIDYIDGSKETIHRTPAIWMGNEKETTVKIATKKKIKSLKLDGGIFMDADIGNNVWK